MSATPKTPWQLLTAAALIAAASWVPARPSRGQGIGLGDFEGRYFFAGGALEEQRMRGAIDEVVDQMNLFIREIARGQVHDNIRIDRSLRIRVIGEQTVSITFGRWGPNLVPIDGRSVDVRGPDGGRTRLSGRFGGGRLYVRQLSSRGVRENWLGLTPDRERLTLQVRVGADQLPADIEYALTYRRR